MSSLDVCPNLFINPLSTRPRSDQTFKRYIPNDKTIINNFNAIKRPAIFYHMVLQLILVEIIVKR